MNSVKIGTYQMDTAFGLYLPEYTIPAPAPQTKFVKVIGRDGSVDLSDAIGLHYDSRSWSLDFKCFDPTVNWHTLTSSVMNAIHGKRLNFEFDDDPDYFWTGRISVSSYVSTRGTGTLKVNITSDPFKYAKLSTIVTKTASTGTEYTGSMVTFNNGLIYDLSADIEPIQDLHGYANPWPAGGGANKLLPNTSDGTSNLNGITLSYSATTEKFSISGTNSKTDAAWLLINWSAGKFPSPSAGETWYFSSNLQTGLYAQITYRDSNNINKSLTGTLVGNGTFRSVSFVAPNDFDHISNLQIGCYKTTGAITASTDIVFELSQTDPTSWTPYENICPISGLTGLSVYVSPTQDPDDATVYNVDLSTQAGTVYGGTVDVVTGVLTVDRASISSYAGETLPGAWISDRDVYAPGTSPTTGAQVVYELATPVTYQLSPQDIEALVGTNNIWTSSGDVTVTVVTPETVTNNGNPAVPTVTASADMVLRWGNYSASVQQGTSTIPQLVLETGDNKIYIIGAGNISFEWSEASL